MYIGEMLMLHTPEQVLPPARSRGVTLLFFVLAICLLAGLLLLPNQQSVKITESSPAAAAVESDQTDEVFIRKSVGPPTVKTGLLDLHGQPVSVACNTCHATRPSNADLRIGGPLTT